jgi:hypothetical protein
VKSHQQPQRQLHLKQQPQQKRPPSEDEVIADEGEAEEIQEIEEPETADADEDKEVGANTGTQHQETPALFSRATPMA